MLEEINKRVADAVTVFRLAPTKIAVFNLLYEGIPQHTIKLVASTAVDALLYVLSNNLVREYVLETYDSEHNHHTLITIHRRENLIEKCLRSTMLSMAGISKKLQDYKLVFPEHSHTLKQLNQLGLLNTLSTQSNV